MTLLVTFVFAGISLAAFLYLALDGRDPERAAGHDVEAPRRPSHQPGQGRSATADGESTDPWAWPAGTADGRSARPEMPRHPPLAGP